MKYEKNEHDIQFENWKHNFILAEADIQLNVLKKKNDLARIHKKSQ